jgi:putative ABC transport system permease protein
MAGRLRAEVGVDAARRELEAIAAGPRPEFARPPWAALGNGLLVSSLQENVTRAVKPALVAVLGAVLLLLAIACVNVTSLQLARGAERRAEFAVRASLGAGRGRIIQQLVIESLVLAAAAGSLALFAADAGVRALVALAPSELPRVDAIHVDVAAFGFAFVVAAVVGLVAGVVPGLHVSRSDTVTGLQHSSARAGRQHHTRRALVVVEIGLALVLLVGAGLLLHSLVRLFSISPGFEPAHVLTMQVQTGGQRFAKPDATYRFFAAALDAVRALPGVEKAGFSSQLPFSGSTDMYGVHFQSSPTGLADADSGAYRYAVTPGYLETMGIALQKGRLINAYDGAGSPDVVVISESIASSRFPKADPIGQRLQIGAANSPWRTIVGVVSSVRQVSLAADIPDAVYVPEVQWTPFADRAMWLVVSGRGDVSALTPAIKAAIWSVDKDQAIARVATLESLVATSAPQRRFAFVIFEAFALAALLLAAIGIYGVLSGSVTERTREIGVRAALGASRRDILLLILRQGLALTAVGVIVGLAGAAVASRALVTLLFGVSRLDPATYGGVVALLALVATVACSVPAWRAARIDPSVTLRAD